MLALDLRDWAAADSWWIWPSEIFDLASKHGLSDPTYTFGWGMAVIGPHRLLKKPMWEVLRL